MSKESSQLKNLFNKVFVQNLGYSIEQQDPNFQAKEFIKITCHADWAQKSLKQRLQHIVTTLHAHWHKTTFEEQALTLILLAPKFRGLCGLIFPEYICTYGLDNYKVSIPALEKLTEFSSAEFAVRPFIKKDPRQMMSQMLKWSKHTNPHVRRLASEGCRPRLPWSEKLNLFIDDPSPVLQVLENLKTDPELYVKKSVANNLNDISKDHPDLILKLAQTWQKNTNPNTQWILKHGLRTLLKQRHPKALKLFGVHSPGQIKVTELKCARKFFVIGQHLEFAFRLKNLESKKSLLRIEYIIHYKNKTNKASVKVFKLTEKLFSPGEYLIQKRHSLKQMTTRTHYPGRHKIEIAINGALLAQTDFELKSNIKTP